MKELCWTRKGEKQRCERRWNQVLIVWLSVSPRSQAARGKEKEKDGTTDSGIKLEPVPGLPGGECRFCLPSSSPPADTHTARILILASAPSSCILQQDPSGFQGSGNTAAPWSSALTSCLLFSSSSSSSCRRRRSLRQLLQPAPEWSSGRGEHCLADLFFCQFNPSLNVKGRCRTQRP